MIEYADPDIISAIKKCNDEIALCDSRIEAGDDILKLWRAQMKTLNSKKEFFIKVKHLLSVGRYREADTMLQSKINEPD